ncbi:PilN domain-containing protein [Gilliamella mensalis]|uniref:PilN domain-containing protein n=1 Tax=Gilliamella mensalis TaxID=1908520 RepID=UPI000A1613E1|nr:PilN domain-containing protein [Gilliamella mensalis]
MIFKRDRIIIDVKLTTLHYKIVNAVKQNAIATTSKDLIAFNYQNATDLDVFIDGLRKKISVHAEFELNFDSSLIQVQQLTLPDVKLNVNELILYIEANIYKLFQLPAKSVFFDFVYSAEQTKQIKVIIIERHYIDNWINLFKKYELLLTFLGCRFENTKVNFLPWRQEKQTKCQRQLVGVVTGFIGIIGCSLCYLWIQARNDLQIYDKKLLHQQEVAQNLTEKLSNDLPNPSLSQKQIQQLLLLLSKQLPSLIWLESFYYEPQKLTIEGKSFSYVEITNFNQYLLTLENITKSQIKTISSNKSNLFFEMEIKLNEQ